MEWACNDLRKAIPTYELIIQKDYLTLQLELIETIIKPNAHLSGSFFFGRNLSCSFTSIILHPSNVGLGRVLNGMSLRPDPP